MQFIKRQAVLLLGVVALPFPAITQQVERHVVAGADVAIFNLVGELRIEPGTGSDVVVEVTRGGPDAGRLEIVVGQIRGRPALRILYPEDRIVYRSLGRGSQSTITVGEDGTFGESRRGDRRIRVTGRGDGLEAHADLRILVPAGKKVRVGLGVGRATARDVSSDLVVDVASADIDASGTKGSLSLDTGSGNVTLSQAEGVLHVDTGSGNVTVTDVKGDVLNVDTGSGEVDLTGAVGDVVTLATGSGGIRASRVQAREVSLETGSGSVDLELVSRTENLSVETGSGSVTVRVPEGFGAAVEIETGSGGIDLGGLTIRAHRLEQDHVSGTIGDGRGKLRIETGSGSVRLTPQQ